MKLLKNRMAKKAILTMTGVAAALGVCGTVAYADSVSNIQSQGMIVYNNETPEDASDDVVLFDARDFEYLYDLALEPYTPTTTP